MRRRHSDSLMAPQPQLGIAVCALFLYIAVCVVCVGAQSTTAPASRPAGFSVTIDAKPSAAVVVLSNSDFLVSLEGSPCAITVRHQFSSPISHLLWTANYYVGSLGGATKCTLTFTKAGDLQLFAKVRGTDTMVWHSNTAGKGVKSMAMDGSLAIGDFQLQDAHKKIVWRSFDVKEFAILPPQKFRSGETLVAPSTFFDDNIMQVLFSGGIYSLKLQAGDLRLYSNFGLGQKLYWSLHRTLFKGDLTKVAYASMVPNIGGLGLFKQDGTVVYTTGPIRDVRSNPRDTYFSVEPDGNLRTIYLMKGEAWEIDFEALPQKCDLPSFCGAYGTCSNNSTCSCPKSFVPNKAKDLTLGCKPRGGFSKCGSGKEHFLELTGYDYIYNQYSAPIKVSMKTCKNDCLKDCSCRAYFYNTKSGLCHVSNEVRTLQKVSDTKKLAFIKL